MGGEIEGKGCLRCNEMADQLGRINCIYIYPSRASLSQAVVIYYWLAGAVLKVTACCIAKAARY